MKTNVVMIRKMDIFEIHQRTKDGMFNATYLLKQWNKNSSSASKTMGNFIRKDSTIEFIDALENDDNLKDVKTHLIKTRGKHGGTWMSPLLFIDFAMWLNPSFKVKVLQFVYDQLIENRHLAGDNYNILTSAIVKLKGVNYSLVAQALNYIVFGRHEKELRQNATQAQLDELIKLQEQYAFAINMGYIKTFDGLMKELRKSWNLKYNPVYKFINK